MKKSLIFLLLLSLALPKAILSYDQPVVSHYKLDIQFNLKENLVSIQAALTIKNTTDKTFSKLPFLLYRLLNVENVYNSSDTQLLFNQDVKQLTDLPSLQANELIVDLLSPLQPKDSMILTIKYSGMILGYSEVMAYVKDRIDDEYTLLRPDTYFYPILTDATFAGSLAANDYKFTYHIVTEVPTGHTVACGGQLINTYTKDKFTSFIYRSKVPTWRIDIAVAKFNFLKNNSISVFYLPEDSLGAKRIMNASQQVIKYYSDLFCVPNSYNGYTIIQIPDGWGSQAAEYYFLQSSAAFKDSSRISEVYHEIAHTWNANPKRDIQRCRYFDEAFASFFEALAIGFFNGPESMKEDMEKSRDIFTRWAEYDPEVFNTPISDYWKKELGRHSYTKGAWSLYLLYNIVGDKTFASIIRSMLTEFHQKEIDFIQFQKLCERIANRDLNTFFNEWIFGTESSAFLVNKLPISEIIKRYNNID